MLHGVGLFVLAQFLAYQIAGHQSRSAIVILEPIGAAGGYACLHDPERGEPVPISIQGSYVVDPRRGGLVVSPVTGSIRVRLAVYKWDRPWRSEEALVEPGTTLALVSGWLGIRASTVDVSAPCGLLLSRSPA